MVSVFDLYMTVVFIVGLWAVLPLFWMLVHTQRPANRTHALSVALRDADEVFQICVEGALVDGATAADLRAQLMALHARAEILRLRAFQAATWREELVSILHGLSREMTCLIRDVKALRARISAIGYVELQNVQLRTVDGKEVAQLPCEQMHGFIAMPALASNMAPTARAVPVDFGNVSNPKENGLPVTV